MVAAKKRRTAAGGISGQLREINARRGLIARALRAGQLQTRVVARHPLPPGLGPEEGDFDDE